jgi:hypothetical protein
MNMDFPLFKAGSADYNEVDMKETGDQIYHMPPLTDEFLYQIIFCMEDQSNTYCLDLAQGQLTQVDFVGDRRREDPSRFIDIPAWRPSDGFRTMDKFVSSLRNPIYREQLKEVLQTGKGVFRQFKDVLREQPALERLWYYFKDKEIRNVIYLWYERNDDAFRLSRLSMEPEDDAKDLLQEDFSVTADISAWDAAVGASMKQFLRSMDAESKVSAMEGENIRSAWENGGDRKEGLVALTSEGVYAGCVSWLQVDDRIAQVLFYYIEPEYRGLGLYKFLFDHMSRRLSRIGVTDVVLPLAGDGLKTASMFDTVSPLSVSRKMVVRTRRWNEQNGSTDMAYL